MPEAGRELERVAIVPRSGACWPTTIVPPINVPAHDNSAMDGYAFARRGAAGRRRDWRCGGRHRLRRQALHGRGRRRRVRAHHDRRGDAGRPRHRRAAGTRANVDGEPVTIAGASRARAARTGASAAKT